MIKINRVMTILAVLLLAGTSFGIMSAEINTSLQDLGAGRWQFTYDIVNTGADPIKQLTIWFDYSAYSNFEITTIDNVGWSEIIIAPDGFLAQGAGYDLLNTTSPLLAGLQLTNFSVAFDYSTQAQPPRNQLFEIIDPDFPDIILFSAQTIPEPASFAVFALGALVLGRRKRQIRA